MNTLEYAIKMEYDGEKYYREKAELNKENGLYIVCTLLAEEEKKHARILEKKREQLVYDLPASDFLKDAKNVYTGLKGIKVEGTNYPSQLDFYRIVSEMEQKSVDLYQTLLADAENEEDSAENYTNICFIRKRNIWKHLKK